jgi:hypothetical protein
MADERDELLSADERRALTELPDALDPPAHLESRIAADLHTRGLLGPSTGLGAGRMSASPVSRRRVLLTAAAAVIVAFAGGWITHAWTTPGVAPPDAGPRYMLLLYGAASTPDEEPRRVSEYRQWAGSIASRGGHVSGEKLEDRAVLLGPESGAHLDPNELGGFFIVSAPNDQAAETLASTHPHLKYGGRVLIRPITRN